MVGLEAGERDLDQEVDGRKAGERGDLDPEIGGGSFSVSVLQ